MTCVGFVPLPPSSGLPQFGGDHDETQPLAESEISDAIAGAFNLVVPLDPVDSVEADETPAAPQATIVDLISLCSTCLANEPRFLDFFQTIVASCELI